MKQRIQTYPRRHRGRFTPLVGLVMIAFGMLLPFVSPAGAQEEPDGVVYAVEISGTIDLGLAPFLDRVIDEAESDPQARAVLIEIDTPGGRLDAALQMRKSILGSEVPTIAFVNREAFSAGALLAIAANEIYIAPGGVLGAATPVDGAGDTASEKVVSAVRSTFRSTAEERGRDPLVAEAMVDPDVEIEGLVERGKLLTLTTEQALEWGYADGVAANRTAALQLAGLGEADVVVRSPSLAERIVRWLTEPIIAGLLFSIGFLLIVGDLLVGGVGLVAAAGVGMLALFFWGHYLAGLTGWEGVVLVVLGVALLAAEVLIVPGFGVAGILGSISLLGGLYLTVAGQEITTDADTRRALTTVGIAFAVLLVGAVAGFALLPQAGRLRGLTLDSRLSRDHQDTGEAEEDDWSSEPSRRRRTATLTALDVSPTLLGATGVARSDLRPGGIAEIEGERIDVVSEGGYIQAGTPVVVVRDEGYRRVVREVETETWQRADESPAG
jgi:membrane-bound serine protease (ClpP class)